MGRFIDRPDNRFSGSLLVPTKSIMSQSSKNLFFVSLFLFGGLATWADECRAQTFQYSPYGAQRGRMVARDGIGHSVRYRWGNGLTPTGGAVLTNAIDAFAPALIAVAGGSRDLEAERRSREADRSRATMRDRLAIAQEEANALLARTARLVDQEFTISKPPPEDISPSPDPDFGSDPWPNVPSNDGSGASSAGAPPPNVGNDPWGSVPDN